jgi:hypothetical protein
MRPTKGLFAPSVTTDLQQLSVCLCVLVLDTSPSTTKQSLSESQKVCRSPARALSLLLSGLLFATYSETRDPSPPHYMLNPLASFAFSWERSRCRYRPSSGSMLTKSDSARYRSSRVQSLTHPLAQAFDGTQPFITQAFNRLQTR